MKQSIKLGNQISRYYKCLEMAEFGAERGWNNQTWLDQAAKLLAQIQKTNPEIVQHLKTEQPAHIVAGT